MPFFYKYVNFKILINDKDENIQAITKTKKFKCKGRKVFDQRRGYKNNQ